ncbi:MAG: EAL domain-containing protein [Gammaproteobacteria bacterium]|nr:EAL domain-containing protein [Gammaproteobacteria bacterium]MDH3751134.1 EAL domain-containing protein [Gammaproteobacteria bacterium]
MRAAIRKVITLDFGKMSAERSPAPDMGPDETIEFKGVALLITNDNLSRQWAPRWLQHAGLEVRVANTPEEALGIASATRPNLLVADAALTGAHGKLLLESLREIHGKDVPLIALCTNNAEVTTAIDADVTDIVRRPYDWQVITRRAVRAVHAHENLAKLRDTRDRLENMHTTAKAAYRDRARAAGLDKLTHLPNGERFRSLLHRAVTIRGNSQRGISVLVIGLDRYRMVNDAVGHENANRLIKQFSDRLRMCLRDRKVIDSADGGMVTAVAARLGGARFALLISNACVDEIMHVKQAILAELEQPFEVAGQSIYLTTSIGAAMFPRDCSSADNLLHCAETAMLDAQESGSGFQFFTQPEDTASSRLLNLDRMLREAIRNDDLELAYQPIMEAESGRVVAAEALLRWHHAEEGTISPADFVPVAEKTGLMKEIGDFVIASACAQLRSWIDAGMEPIRIAVNLSLCQLLRGDVASVVEKALQENSIDSRLLEIELSERGVLNQRHEVISEVHRLRAVGVRISIDDFGTGHASIAYLKDLPVDVIKIDRSYVSGAGRSARDEAIAAGMVALAQRLQATVIAEGVETREQLETLRDWGSQECQGFYFSPAVPADEFMEKFG